MRIPEVGDCHVVEIHPDKRLVSRPLVVRHMLINERAHSMAGLEGTISTNKNRNKEHQKFTHVTAATKHFSHIRSGALEAKYV
jgi:hypothetical protein